MLGIPRVLIVFCLFICNFRYFPFLIWEGILLLIAAVPVHCLLVFYSTIPWLLLPALIGSLMRI